ncbi:MAG: thioesterase family protein [Pseudomonadota bacterium]|nr:thioesterase family protein [Pseudomonadota bacterium]
METHAVPFTNRFQTRAEWAHCDQLGQMFYPNYFQWFDIGTHRLLDAGGEPYDQLIKKRNIAGLPLVDARASFKGRCRWTDDLEVESFISRFGSKSFTVSHNIWNDSAIAVEGEEIRIWGLFDPDDQTKLKAGKIPADFKRNFS